MFPKDQGGLRLVDLTAKHRAALAQWAFRVQNDNFLQTSCRTALNDMLREDIWLINMKPKEIPDYFLESFWRHVLQAWCEATSILA